MRLTMFAEVAILFFFLLHFRYTRDIFDHLASVLSRIHHHYIAPHKTPGSLFYCSYNSCAEMLSPGNSGVVSIPDSAISETDSVLPSAKEWIETIRGSGSIVQSSGTPLAA